MNQNRSGRWCKERMGKREEANETDEGKLRVSWAIKILLGGCWELLSPGQLYLEKA